ncbi:uncharacterized protein LOC126376657 [Pectinophora gossypiella]|uniref:uncharacterized protein LOC126371095 n=1 Tax=Pectinophora gossypiella TaxID=13191 RepID=UPI00214E0798|nr:uncharacterized protein LOC126371095 [Pectinophora gossypiella]XP_049880159.1 uncharacterized protein LOC126376657 [Pectinophora gossypiella]
MSGTSDDEGRDMEIELAQLEAKRSSIKGQTTKIEKFLKSFDDSEAVDAVEFNKLTLKLHKCMELIQKFETLQSRIEVLNSGKLEEELTTRDTMEENLHNCIATVQFLLEKHKLKSSSGADNTNSSTTTHHSHCRDTIVGFNLPQIKINKFDGTFYKWLEFRDTYESLIHDNISLKPIHKFHYLCSYLEGEAARVISNLEISAANYSEAWTLLCERSLMSLPSPELIDINPRRLNRYEVLEQMRQHFWKRWQSEYVTELQHRCKWKTRCRDLKEGELVIIKDDNVPPLLWRLGRVQKLYPGADGVPRVADIKTSRGVIRRALNRISLLLDDIA